MMNDKLQFSVVICAHNEQDWITSTLDSLLKQVRLPDEIIVVNNASTDRTAEVVTEFIAAHPQANAKIIDQPRKGLPHAREAGWRSACGDIVISTDADIRFPPKWLQNYETYFQKNPDVAAASGPVRYYDALFFINWMSALFEMAFQPEGLGRFLTKQYHISGGNGAYRRSALDSVNGYLGRPKGVFEDMYMAENLQNNGFKVRFLWNNPVWHTFRRFKKDGWRGYMRFIFGYTADNVYPDHMQDDQN